VTTKFSTPAPEEFTDYRHTAQRLRQQEQAALQRRYRQVLRVSKVAYRLLHEQFDAQRVVLFGSLLRPELFHSQSDVDLAVWGLSDQECAEAQATLIAIEPEIGVDLLNMDITGPSLRNVIEQDDFNRANSGWEKTEMEDGDIGTHLLHDGREAALAARIRSEAVDVGQVVDRAERLLAKANSSGDNDWLDGVALNLHSFYTGIEKIFEEIAKEIDGGLPTGAEWHQKLLVQIAAEIPKRRPAAIQRSTRDCLDEYRRFRHAVRTVYTFNLRPARPQDLTTDVRFCYLSFRQDIEAFCAFLDNLATDEQAS
jgi:predicted nucleotidyltransferase